MVNTKMLSLGGWKGDTIVPETGVMWSGFREYEPFQDALGDWWILTDPDYPFLGPFFTEGYAREAPFSASHPSARSMFPKRQPVKPYRVRR